MASQDTEDERTEELETLGAIYPELELDPGDPFAARIQLPVAPTTPLPVNFEPGQGVERLAHLPPIHLHITLPSDYPAEAPRRLSALDGHAFHVVDVALLDAIVVVVL
jgi:E3 ubiquitin-protein ligase RNF14